MKIEQVQKILYTVKGHKGRFVFGYVEETPVVIMQGRVHYYEGRDQKYRTSGRRIRTV